MTDLEMSLVMDCAALAPSIHNTQPWEFVVRDETLELHVDRSRRLAYLDPDGRLQYISCGAAVEFARLGVRSLGRACTVELLPDPAQADFVARLVIGGPEPASPEERELVTAMARRYTDRGPYDDRSVPAAFFDAVRPELEKYGIVLRTVERQDERTALALLLTDAETAEAGSARYAEELARWVHSGDDGVPPPAVPDWPKDRVSEMPLRDFLARGQTLRASAPDPPAVARDNLVVLVADGEDRRSWLMTGAALALLQLRATVAGISTQPLGPATDFPAARQRLRRELGLIGVPQFALRMGYGAGRPWTGRRLTAARVP